MTSHQPNSNQKNQSVVSTPTGEYMPQPFQNIEQGMHQKEKRHGEQFNIRFIYILTEMGQTQLSQMGQTVNQQPQLSQQTNALTYSEAVKLPNQVSRNNNQFYLKWKLMNSFEIDCRRALYNITVDRL